MKLGKTIMKLETLFLCMPKSNEKRKKNLVKKFDKIDIKNSNSSNNNDKEKDTFVLIGSKIR